MGVKKGTNNFHKLQKGKILATKEKIKKALQELEQTDIFLHIHEILKAVVDKTGLSISTIRKNELYYELCVKGFKKQISKNCNNAILEYDDVNQKYFLLEKENEKLKNQIQALTNALSKTPHLKEYVENEKLIEQLKAILKNVVQHASNITIIDDQIMADNNKLNEKVIYKSNLVKHLFENEIHK